MINIESALYTLFKSVIGSETLIFEDQDAPQPALPYWTLKVIAQSGVGIDAIGGEIVDANGNVKVKGIREATARISRYGTESLSNVGEFKSKLAKQTVKDAFNIANIALFDIGNVQDTTFLQDGVKYEERATIDTFVRYGTELLDLVGIIETVDATGNYQGLPDLTHHVIVDLT